jgi:hypothetical protein
MWEQFVDRLVQSKNIRHSSIVLLISPKIASLPLPIQRFDDPFFPYSKALISATQDLVCAYMFDFAAFLVYGAPGAVALERTIGFVSNEHIRILHGDFGGQAYNVITDNIAFTVDALTIAHQRDLKHYLSVSPYAAFVVRHADNPLDLPLQRGGEYLPRKQQLRIINSGENIMELKVIGSEIVGRGEDFANIARQRLLTLGDEL